MPEMPLTSKALTVFTIHESRKAEADLFLSVTQIATNFTSIEDTYNYSSSLLA